jgi:hypothetical protein
LESSIVHVPCERFDIIDGLQYVFDKEAYSPWSQVDDLPEEAALQFGAQSFFSHQIDLSAQGS